MAIGHHAFALTDEQRRLCEKARRLARENIAGVAAGGAPSRVNRPLLRVLGDVGLLPLLFPSEHGGAHPQGISALNLCLLRESLARECTDAETALALQGLGAYPILQSGSVNLVSRWIPKVARGEAVAAFALTEPNAGSDAAALEVRAERDGARAWRLTGEKTFVSNAPEADVYTLFARTGEAGAKGITAFVVPGDARGLSGDRIELLAPHAIGRLALDAVRVADEQVLGGVGQGFSVAMRTLDLFRPSVGAFAVGMAQAALDAAVEHAGRRRQFGKALREFQAVSHQLAEMATRTEAARLLVYRAAAAYDATGAADTKLAAMAKLFATEAAQFVVDAAIQIHGAAALVRGHLLEHLYREVRAPRIYEGTSEIQRSIIARELYRSAPAD